MKKYTIGFIIFSLGIGWLFILEDNNDEPIITNIQIVDNTIKKNIESQVTVVSILEKEKEINEAVKSVKTIHHVVKVASLQQSLQNRNLNELSDKEISNLLQDDDVSISTKKEIVSLLAKRATVVSIKLLFTNIENLYDDSLIEHIQGTIIELSKNIVDLGQEEELQSLLSDAYFLYKNDDRFNGSLITSISKMENEDALTLLEEEFVSDETSDDIKNIILDSMQNLKSEEYVSQLSTKLASDNSELISLSTRALASIGNENAVTALLTWSSDFSDEDDTNTVSETFQLLAKNYPKLKEDILDELEIYDFDSDSVKDEIISIFL